MTVGEGPVRRRLRPRVKQARRLGARQARPKASCSECAAVSVYTEHINRRCARMFEIPDQEEPERCEGRFKSAVSPSDWAECAECRVTGVVGDGPCERCGGAGWRYTGGEL